MIEDRQLLKLMGITVTVKQAVQYRSGDYLALELVVGRWRGFIKAHRDMLINTLMGAQLVEVVCVSRDDLMQLVRVEDEKVIGTFSLE